MPFGLPRHCTLISDHERASWRRSTSTSVCARSLSSGERPRAQQRACKAVAVSGFGAFSSATVPPRTPNQPAAARASCLHARHTRLAPLEAKRSRGTSRWSPSLQVRRKVLAKHTLSDNYSGESTVNYSGHFRGSVPILHRFCDAITSRRNAPHVLPTRTSGGPGGSENDSFRARSP